MYMFCCTGKESVGKMRLKKIKTFLFFILEIEYSFEGER